MQHRKRAAATATAVGVIALSVLGAGAAHAAPAKPDLVVTSIAWAPTTAAKGNAISFAVTIQNRGAAATPEHVINGVGFQVDGRLVTWTDYHDVPVQPGESVALTANGGPTGSPTWTATAGRHEVLAFVDDAGRIAESDEGNNRTRTTMTVADRPVMTTTLKGTSSSTTFSAAKQRTGIASSVRGDGYAACFTGTGKVVAGTEKRIGTYGAGASSYYTGGPFSGSGLADVPAGATRATSAGIQFNEILKWNYGDPAMKLTCATGQTPAFTKLHVRTLTSNRWTLNEGGWSGVTMLSSVTTPVDAVWRF